MLLKQKFMGRKPLYVLPLFILLATGCSKQNEKHPEILLSDRHSASYEWVYEVAKKYVQNKLSQKTNVHKQTQFYRNHGDVLPTLVLLDYHHDVMPDQNYATFDEEGFVDFDKKSVNSADWAGMLLEQRLIGKIIWVSGRDLLLPNRNSRANWFDRSVTKAAPGVKEYEKDHVQLMDFHDLIKAEFEEPLIITLDFDVFTRNPGPDPDSFCRELADWIQNQSPLTFTMCLSSVYQDSPADLWRWLKIFLAEYKKPAEWKLCSGLYGEKIETNDDFVGWMRWNDEQNFFKNGKECFWPGPYLWFNAPAYIAKALIEKQISADERNGPAHYAATQDVLKSWEALAERTELESKIRAGLGVDENQNVGKKLGEMAFSHMFDNVRTIPLQSCESMSPQSTGIAVRFRTKNTDRGCLSLYGGVDLLNLEQNIAFCASEAAKDPRYSAIAAEELSDLFANVSVFGRWKKMSEAFDFCPGQDSLLLEFAEDRTLLQGAVAMERNYSREDFLTRLSLKAGLGPDGWKKKDCVLYKAQSLSYFYGYCKN